MSGIRLFTVFAIAFLCGLGGIVALGVFAWMSEAGSKPSASHTPVVLQALSGDILVAPQIAPEDMDALMMRGIKTVIDLRPDGEVEGQPGSALIEALARNRTMAFAYIPVPHGDVPDAAANRLAGILARNPGPVLLYCRSGRRAARAWALAEASRPDGLSVAEIEARVGAVGQSVDDLSDRLRLRAALRAASQ